MDISKLSRDKNKVLDAIAEVKMGNNYAMIAKKKIDIVFPKYWLESAMGSFDLKVNVFAMVAIIVEEQYFSHIDALTSISFNPIDSSSVKIEDIEYFKLSYQPGETITDSTTLVKDGLTAARAFDEFLSKSKIPWYLRYQDICLAFQTSQLHAGYNTRTDKSIESFMTGNRSRDPKNTAKLYRYTLKSQDDLDKTRPVMLPLTSVSGATSTSSRMAGSYMKDGIVESVVNQTTTLEDSDRLLFL